jgi:hypothetical protein
MAYVRGGGEGFDISDDRARRWVRVEESLTDPGRRADNEHGVPLV